MNFQKSFAARSALALVAAGSAVALTACGAGQITQTSNQAAAVNGVHGHAANVSLRDATIVLGKDGNAYLKFTAANLEDKAEAATLQSISVDGKDVNVNGEKTIKAGCSLVATVPDEVAEIKKGAENVCTSYASPKLSSTEGVYPGGSLPVKFTFDSGTAELDAPIVGEHPTAGEAYRNPANEIISPEEFHSEESHGAGSH